MNKDQCRKTIFNLGMRFGVSPKLISERLLSDDDKRDMLTGEINENVLAVAVGAWKDAGMPDYVGRTPQQSKPSH